MYRFFKCNRLGGFRLTDQNRKIQTDEYFYYDVHVCDTSRSIKAGLKAKWMLEVTEEEASQNISIPQTHSEDEKIVSIAMKKVLPSKACVDAKEMNKSLESRQTARSFRKSPMQKQKDEDKPVIPNFNEAERRMRERQADITTKGSDEILKSLAQVKEKETVVVVAEKNDVVADLAKDMGADNSQLSTPNFDEKKQEAKIQINQEIEKRVKRRKKVETTSQEK